MNTGAGSYEFNSVCIACYINPLQELTGSSPKARLLTAGAHEPSAAPTPGTERIRFLKF
jgi:hypothetical protein